MNRKFKTIQEFTKYIRTLPSEEQKITLRVGIGKGLAEPFAYKNKVEPVLNPSTGEYLGIYMNPTEQDKKDFLGDTFWPKPTYYDYDKGRVIDGIYFILKDNISFDLTKERDLKNWMWIQHVDDIVLYARDLKNRRNSHFYIEVPQYEAENQLETLSIQKTALDRLELISDGGFRELYDLLGGVSISISEKEAKLLIWKDILSNENYAKKVITTIDDPDYEVRARIRVALKNKIISLVDGNYLFGEMILGQKESHIIKFIKEATGEKKKVAAQLIKEINDSIGYKPEN